MKTVAAQLRAKLRLPAFGAPLFIVSNPDLCVAQCKSGVVGSFPALNARGSDDALDKWITDVKNRLEPGDAPFAVNQIVHRSNARLMKDMDVIVKHEVPIVITSLGARPEINEAVHSYGGLVFHDVINNKFARKAVEKGADGLVLVAWGAGGHAGTLSPFPLISEVREWWDGPVALSGAIGLFHAGVEYGWWPGVTSCAVIAGGGSGNALEDIMNTPLVRCDEPAWTLAGISLAGYNFLVSSAAALAIFVLMVKDRNA